MSPVHQHPGAGAASVARDGPPPGRAPRPADRADARTDGPSDARPGDGRDARLDDGLGAPLDGRLDGGLGDGLDGPLGAPLDGRLDAGLGTRIDGRAGPVRPPVAWGALTALRLQRLAGNRAVAGAMHRSRPAATVQRRIPSAARTNPLTAPGAMDRAAHVAGLERLNERALSELTPADRATVMASAHAAAGSAAAYAALPPADRAGTLATALRAFRPALVLGDPALINIGARPSTADTANIATLVTNATALMNLCMAPAAVPHLRDVFGAANVATAQARYGAGAARLAWLQTNGRIVTDRSGYSGQVGLGGLTNSARMALSPGTIDSPANDPATVLVLHESMHAGTSTVKDYGYLGTPGFTTLAPAVKLDNAAHYEVPARRLLGMAHAYPGTVFVEAGTSVTVGGVVHTAAPLTALEQANRDASEVTRSAWNMGLNLHSLWVRLNLSRGDWASVDLTAAYSGATATHFADCMPYWSKVEALTVHDRPGLSAAGAFSSTAPVTQTDVALSEGLVRLVSRAKDLARVQLATEATARAFMAAQATAGEIAAATTSAAMKDLLLLCVCRAVGSMTGAPARDVRVLTEMATNRTYAAMLTPRSPAAFA
ncbi:hypothetical protein [Cellulomonas sp. URHB0016]